MVDGEQQPVSIEFEAPGPGSWSSDVVHFTRPVSRFQAEIFASNISKGFREGMRDYGLLIDTLDYRFINGFAYSVVLPAPESEIPARFEAAARVFKHKIWRDDLAHWDNEIKPAAIKAHQDLLAVDVAALSQDDIIEYLDRCRDHLQRMIRQHHRFNAAAIIPAGDFIVHVGAWTGLPAGEFLALTRGSAPESAGSFPELDRLSAAIKRTPAAYELLNSDATNAQILGQLMQTPGDVGTAAKAYLGIVGDRLLDSLDAGEPAAIEVPEVLVSGIRLAVDEGARAANTASEAEVAQVRAKVPAEHRAQFDELLGEVRLMSRLRDERGLYSDVSAGGIMRRALLVAGARLVGEGRIAEPTHLAEADYEEILTLIRGEEGPTAAELAARADYRKTHRSEQAPDFLGDPPSAPPPLDGLPPDVVRVMQALGASIGAIFEPGESTTEPMIVRGTGASPGTYTGTARVIDGPVDFGRLERGDVLVTATTTESFNIVLPLLGGIVTNNGGLLSHAAIVGREYGIPSVVGTRNATARIPDGAQVTVNGTTGEVTFDAA